MLFRIHPCSSRLIASTKLTILLIPFLPTSQGDFLVREEKGQRVYFDFFEEAFNYIAAKGYARMPKGEEAEWMDLMVSVLDWMDGDCCTDVSTCRCRWVVCAFGLAIYLEQPRVLDGSGIDCKTAECRDDIKGVACYEMAWKLQFMS